MPWKNALTLVAASACLLGSGACSSRGNGGAPEAGSDAQAAPPPANLVVDGTSGQPCDKDVDCIPEGGPGVNRCSLSQPATFTGVTIQRFASPVCIVGTSAGAHNCDPAPSGDPAGVDVHFCDGPDDPSAPGVCVSDTPAPVRGSGTCLPKCTFGPDGSPAVGCLGSAACFPVGFVLGIRDIVTPTAMGFGYCRGFCASDADCSALGANYECQTDIGYCTKATAARTKSPGAACSPPSAAGDSECFCAAGANGGYCTTACVIGGAPCASGWVCDNGNPKTLQIAGEVAFGDEVSLASSGTVAIASQSAGTGGTCYAPCVVSDAGATGPADAAATIADSSASTDATEDGSVATDAGGGRDVDSIEGGGSIEDSQPDGIAICPPGASCRATTVAGPDCLPSP